VDVIPSLDLLDGSVVRLRRGDFADRTVYGDPLAVLQRLGAPRGSRLHVVDLAGSRDGRPVALDVVRRLASEGLRIQVGGGVRSAGDLEAWLSAGAEKVVVGTAASEQPDLLRRFPPDRIIPAIDVRDGEVRVAGWTQSSSASLSDVLRLVESTGPTEILVTDITRDGLLAGPSLALYRQLAAMTRLRIIASGGVTTYGDVVALARLGNVSGCVIGRALLDGRLTVAEARARAATPRAIPPRIIPCLDVRDGRVVKGVNFEGIRDAGDPVECAMRYEEEGADEIAVLDISATDRGHATALETVRRIAESIYIPLTVGGGVRTKGDFRALLRAGADRVAINTAAVQRPELIAECAAEFGAQAVVVSCDARQGEVMIRSGKESAGLDAVSWCRKAEALGAGEIMLTSVDRDGTQSGFDIDLLRAVTGAVRINVIASGGAGDPAHFAEAIERGGATAALAASLFHDRRLTIAGVKQYLANEGIPVR
jgi:cyclase